MHNYPNNSIQLTIWSTYVPNNQPIIQSLHLSSTHLYINDDDDDDDDHSNNNDNNNNIVIILLLIIVSEALFCLRRDTNIYNSIWGVTEFQDTYHGFLYFLTFLSFSLWILYVSGARETQEDTL